METPKNTVPPRPVRRLGLSRRYCGTLLTPSIGSTSNSIQKDDLPKEVEKSDTTKSSVNQMKVIGNNKQNETQSSQSNNSENVNSSIETPTSSRINQTKFKLSLQRKTTCETLSRKRMQYLKSESLIQPKRLKLDERRLPIASISQTENQIESCDNGNDCEITKTDDENSLTKAIAELKSTIANIEKYEQRSSELLGLISKWRKAGEKTIENLKRKIQPQQDVKVILHHFNINPNLFNVDEE